MTASLSRPVFDDAGELVAAGAELVDSGIGRARDVLDTIAERASDALDSTEIDPATLRAGASRILPAGWTDRTDDCTREIEATEDRLRLKTAIVTAIVAFVLSAVVFLTAREIARRAQRRGDQRRRAERPPADSRG